jgi:hypothetical protein
MRHIVYSVFFALAGLLSFSAQAAPVTIDFEEFSIGDGPTGSMGTYDWFQSQGYEFNGGNGPCGQYGCPPEIFIGDSGSKSLGAINGWAGQDGFGAEVFVSMRKADGGAFAISSLDLVLEGFISTSIIGTLAGGGAADLSVSVGTGDWLNLELVTFSAEGGNSGFLNEAGAAVELDNIAVSAVPVPAAVWLFGSALAGLGWMRRKQTA